jgi:hypothetical protein
MNVIITSFGGRVPPARKRGRFAQDLIRPLQLSILVFQLLQPLAFIRGQAGAVAGIPFGLAHPTAQRLCRGSQLRGDRHDRRPLCEAYSVPCSWTIRTARSRISGEYRFGRAIGLHPLNE